MVKRAVNWMQKGSREGLWTRGGSSCRGQRGQELTRKACTSGAPFFLSFRGMSKVKKGTQGTGGVFGCRLHPITGLRSSYGGWHSSPPFSGQYFLLCQRLDGNLFEAFQHLG